MIWNGFCQCRNSHRGQSACHSKQHAPSTGQRHRRPRNHSFSVLPSERLWAKSSVIGSNLKPSKAARRVTPISRGRFIPSSSQPAVSASLRDLISLVLGRQLGSSSMETFSPSLVLPARWVARTTVGVVVFVSFSCAQYSGISSTSLFLSGGEHGVDIRVGGELEPSFFFS